MFGRMKPGNSHCPFCSRKNIYNGTNKKGDKNMYNIDMI